MLLSEQNITEFLSTNLTETYPDWNDSDEYLAGAIRRDGNWYFKAVSSIAANQARPTQNKAQWFKYRPSQRYAMLDMASLTFSTNEAIVPAGSPIIVTYEHKRFDVLAFGGVIADSILIELSEDDFATIAWSETITNHGWVTPNSEPNWFDYYYGAFDEEGEFSNYFVRPPAFDGKMRVTMNPSVINSGLVKCGYMISGSSINCGLTLDVVNRGSTDYSLMDTDEFGTTTLSYRDAQRDMSINTSVATNRSTWLDKKSRRLKGSSILVVGDESDGVFENLLMLGFLGEVDIPAVSDELTTTSWQVTEKIY